MNKRGVSLISVIITIIVIIVLASISFNASNTIDEASKGKALQELSEVKKGMLTVRSINAKSGIDESTLNKGFIKVKVENPPDNFVSYDNDTPTGYVIDLSVIDYNKLKTGQGYSNVSSGDTITFNETDVYVYDAALKVFYAKSGRYVDGYDTDDDNGSVRLNGPTVQVAVRDDGTLEIAVTPAYGGRILSVLVDGKKAATSDGTNFEYVVKDKYSCTIIATEEDGASTTKVVKVKTDNSGNNGDTDISTPKIISYVCNYKEGSAEVSVIAQDKKAKIVSYAVTVGEDSVPSSDSWVDIAEPANSYTTKFTVTENGVYTVWIKNNFGRIGNASKNIRVILNVIYKYDANGGESIDIVETTQRVPCNTFVSLTPRVSRSHYEFLGWNTKMTAQEPLTVYNIGTENDVVLYPIFRPKIKLPKPTLAQSSYTYNGKTQTLQLNSFDSSLFTITENTMVDAGSKTAVVTIINKDRYEWVDGTDDVWTYTWTIDKKKVSAEWEATRLFTYNGNPQAPSVSITSGVDGETLSIERTSEIDAGDYVSTATLTGITGGRAKLSNYELQNTTVSYRIQNADMNGSIKITGTNEFGKTLTVDTSGIVPTGCTLKYQWYSSLKDGVSGGMAISGATSNTYTLPKNMVGKYVYVLVTASKKNYNTKVFVDNTDDENNGSAITICVHTWQDATCTTPKTCTKCGTTEGYALGHNFSAATCTAPKKCARCGITEGTALGHAWKDATCTTPKKCTRCGITEGNALGHSYNPATCVLPKTCSRCGVTTGSPNGHTWGAWKYDKTSGSTTHYRVCSVCNEKQTESHTFGSSSVIKEATCTEDGISRRVCSVCNANEDTVIAKLGHNWATVWSATQTQHWHDCKNSGCTAKTAIANHTYGSWSSNGSSTHTRTCTVCGHAQGASHTYGSYTTTKSPTCIETGTKTRTCTACGRKDTQTIAANGHTWGSWTGSGTTAEHVRHCSVCHQQGTEAHNWGAYWVVTKATCVSTGTKRRQCSVCSATQNATIPKLTTHTYSKVWSSNTSQHWHACTVAGCTAKSNVGSHSLNSSTNTCYTCKRKGPFSVLN